MKNDDFYARLFGLAPDPAANTLSKILGLEPPPLASPSPTPLWKLIGSAPPAPAFTSLSTLLGLAAPPAPAPAPVGIWFRDKYFSEPTALESAWLPAMPGVYAILVSDFSCRPRQFRVLYFGKAADISSRVVSTHEKRGEWTRAAGGAGKLYVAYHLMSGSHEWQRAAFEEDLIKHYTPECNKTFNYLADLLGY